MFDFSDFAINTATLLAIIKVLLIFVICYIAVKILTKAFEKVIDRSRHIDASLRSFFKSAVKIGLWVLAVLIAAQTLGIPITSLVAVLSVAGVALSLALQGLLSNLFSGITILMTRPIAVGDFVEIGGQSGNVKGLGLFYTELATIDNKIIYVPNGEITSGKIINYTAEKLRRVDLTIGTSYDCATNDAREAMLEAAAMDEKILSAPAPFVAICNYASSSIEYTVRVWCKTEDYWDVYFALNENIRECFAKHGVEMSYEHVNVHIVEK